jgi:hypothetical protein
MRPPGYRPGDRPCGAAGMIWRARRPPPSLQGTATPRVGLPLTPGHAVAGCASDRHPDGRRCGTRLRPARPEAQQNRARSLPEGREAPKQLDPYGCGVRFSAKSITSRGVSPGLVGCRYRLILLSSPLSISAWAGTSDPAYKTFSDLVGEANTVYKSIYLIRHGVLSCLSIFNGFM